MVMLPPVPIGPMVIVVTSFPVHVIAMRLVLPLNAIGGFTWAPGVDAAMLRATGAQKRNDQDGGKQETA